VFTVKSLLYVFSFFLFEVRDFDYLSFLYSFFLSFIVYYFYNAFLNFHKCLSFMLHLTSSLFCRFAKQSWILQFALLSFVQGLICKWTSAQESRLVLGYKSLIKTALGLGSVKLKLGWIGQEKLSLNNKKNASAQWIVITVHLDTQNTLRQKHSQRNQSESLCNDYWTVTTICKTYNDSVIVTMIHETYNDL
jgi:hypothetical protein